MGCNKSDGTLTVNFMPGDNELPPETILTGRELQRAENVEDALIGQDGLCKEFFKRNGKIRDVLSGRRGEGCGESDPQTGRWATRKRG